MSYDDDELEDYEEYDEEEETPKAKRKKKKRKNSEIVEAIRTHKIVNAQQASTEMMKLVEASIKLKKRIIVDETEPMFLRNQVAAEMLDRTVPRPSQNININGAMMQVNMTDRELKELLAEKLMKGRG